MPALKGGHATRRACSLYGSQAIFMTSYPRIPQSAPMEQRGRPAFDAGGLVACNARMPAGWVQSVACVTTTRAEYGIYRPLLFALHRTGYRCTRLVGGTHLRSAFGRTIDDVRGDDVGPIVEVDFLAERDDAFGVTRSAGDALAAFGRALHADPPDLVFVLGDRYEMLSAAIAALLTRVPIAHLHGGDRTAGAYDDAMRHAISKLAAWHFPALPEHARRLEALGEPAERITVCGSLALDGLHQFEPLSASALSKHLGFELSDRYAVVCVHPETLAGAQPANLFRQVAEGLGAFDGPVVVIGSNADEGHRALADVVRAWSERRPRTYRVASLPQRVYWSLLAHAAVLVGNSSAGVIESASLRLPTVNVGRRPSGRTRAGNVIDVTWDATAIADAIRAATAPSFRAGLAGLVNPWGDGRAAERILATVATLPPRAVLLDKAGA